MGSIGYCVGTDWSWKGNTKTYLDEQNTSMHTATTFRVLASTTKGSVYYAALERTMPSGNRDVIALVMPYTFHGKGYNRELVVKDQDETMGPVDADCPERILKLLTEPLSDYATAWRERCYANIERDKQRANQKVEVGSTIRFTNPISFFDGVKVTEFKVYSWGRRKRLFALPENGHSFLCRIDKWTWRNNPWEVVK